MKSLPTQPAQSSLSLVRFSAEIYFPNLSQVQTLFPPSHPKAALVSSSSAQNLFSLPDPNGFVETYSDYDIHPKKFGLKLTKAVPSL